MEICQYTGAPFCMRPEAQICLCTALYGMDFWLTLFDIIDFFNIGWGRNRKLQNPELKFKSRSATNSFRSFLQFRRTEKPDRKTARPLQSLLSKRTQIQRWISAWTQRRVMMLNCWNFHTTVGLTVYKWEESDYRWSPENLGRLLKWKKISMLVKTT